MEAGCRQVDADLSPPFDSFVRWPVRLPAADNIDLKPVFITSYTAGLLQANSASFFTEREGKKSYCTFCTVVAASRGTMVI